MKKEKKYNNKNQIKSKKKFFKIIFHNLLKIKYFKLYLKICKN